MTYDEVHDRVITALLFTSEPHHDSVDAIRVALDVPGIPRPGETYVHYAKPECIVVVDKIAINKKRLLPTLDMTKALPLDVVYTHDGNTWTDALENFLALVPGDATRYTRCSSVSDGPASGRDG